MFGLSVSAIKLLIQSQSRAFQGCNVLKMVIRANQKLRVHSFGTILAILFSGLGITEYTEFQFRKERSF